MIEKYRNMRKYTQEEFAEILEISTRQLQRIENGESNPSIKTLKNIINILKMEDNDIATLIKKELKG